MHIGLLAFDSQHWITCRLHNSCIHSFCVVYAVLDTTAPGQTLMLGITAVISASDITNYSINEYTTGPLEEVQRAHSGHGLG